MAAFFLWCSTMNSNSQSNGRAGRLLKDQKRFFCAQRKIVNWIPIFGIDGDESCKGRWKVDGTTKGLRIDQSCWWWCPTIAIVLATKGFNKKKFFQLRRSHHNTQSHSFTCSLTTWSLLHAQAKWHNFPFYYLSFRSIANLTSSFYYVIKTTRDRVSRTNQQGWKKIIVQRQQKANYQPDNVWLRQKWVAQHCESGLHDRRSFGLWKTIKYPASSNHKYSSRIEFLPSTNDKLWQK